jgi:hypothetical protein
VLQRVRPIISNDIMSGKEGSHFNINNKISFLKVKAEINDLSVPLGGGTSNLKSEVLE